MSKSLHISETLKLPLELAARTQCIFAQKGAGKTYAAGVMTEEMLGAGVQVVVLDPTGVWWGLQSSADGGKSPYEIIVMGGAHADVPLEPDAGEIVAQFIVESGQSVVLDVSQMETQAAQDRFALALATKLYRLKAHDKANVHIFLDEADQFCPLKPQKGQEKLLHAWDMICRLGRSRGLGFTAISQRPAVVHTNIRNNVDLLTCLRVTGMQDYKALREWTSINATGDQAKEFLEKVPTLANGEAFFWSPAWLKIFELAKIRKKHTFDSSRTPKPGERAVVPKARRAPDLTKLTEQIKASVERAKINDPKELQKKLAEVQAELRKLKSAVPPPAKVEQKRVEVPVVKPAELQRIERHAKYFSDLLNDYNKRVDAFGELINPIWKNILITRDELKQMHADLQTAIARKNAPAVAAPPRNFFLNERHTSHVPKLTPSSKQAAMARPPVHSAGLSENNGDVASGGITPRQQRMLDVAATLSVLNSPVTRETVCGWLGIHPRGGSVGEELKALTDAGLITVDRGAITITEAGIAKAQQLDPAAAIDSAKAGLGPRQRRIFEIVESVYPETISREAIAEQMQIHPRGGSFGEDLGALRGRGLIEGSKGVFKVRDFLFAAAGSSA